MGNFFRPRRPFHGRPQRQKKFYQTNFRIEAPVLRVIDEESKQIGVLSKQEALNMAQGKERDLVLIVPQASPPIAKIIDFKKFLYQEEKKQQSARKGIKKSVVKDLKLSLFIAEADLVRLIEKGKEFLTDGNQLRLNLTLKGREVVKRDMAYQLIRKYIQSLGDVAVAKEPRLEGRVIRAVIARKK